jgi:glycosyltransferase involved in cell wall biosynthesis
MKIALIIERVNIVLGGAERSVMELSTILTNLGHEVDILAAKGQTDANNIYLLCSNNSGKRTNFYAFSKAIKKHISQNRYDIIHSVLPFSFSDVYQPRGGCYIEAIRQNAVSYENIVLSHYKRLTAFANWRRTALTLAERKVCKMNNGPVIAALSNYVAEQFRKYYCVGNQRIEIIPNGIWINKYSDPSEAEHLRAQIFFKLGLKEADKPILFLFVANNFRLKGLDVMMEALAILNQSQMPSPPYLIVAGGGKINKYKSTARKFKVDGKVVFLGHLPNIQNALSISDVAVLPTFYDPCSRYILEALVAYKPVITSKFNNFEV